jgi:Ice-binding-like/Bacterial Ig-like domain
MRKMKVSKIWILAFLLAVLVGGCGREQTGFVAPSVISTNPANLATGVPVTQIVTATFNNAMNPTTINTVTFIVAGPGGAAIMGTVTYSGTTAMFTPAANLLPSTQYSGTITTGAKDPAGNALAINFVWTFTTGTIPTVTSVTPPNNSTLVCPDTAVITATFSHAMNPATINTTTFTLTGPGGASVAGQVSYAAATNIATFTPSGALAPGTTFTATITTGAQDTSGIALAANFVWTFTSASCPPPTVASVTPPNGSTSVCSNTAVITAAFSHAMNPATINTTTFTLTGTGGASVSGQVSYDTTTNIATFTPSGSLAASTSFTATITTGAQDTFGIALAANFVWTFTTSATCPPTVTSVTPPNNSTLVCPNTAVITATFSHAMNSATINTTTFTLTGTGGASVAGQVTYAAATNIATFTPTGTLAPSTSFTATITTGAQDTFGIALVANFVWTFTTSATCLPPGSITLGAACSFGILAGSTVTNVPGTATTVSGDVGVSPGTAITGFGPASITGMFHSNDSVAMAAQADLLTAYNAAAGAAGGAVLPADIGGQTLPPGIYKTTSAQPSLGITGTLTLDAGGDPNAVWIFQIVSTLTTAANNSEVIPINGADFHNVFWQVGSSATLGTFTIFKGTIMAQTSITLTTGATLYGRALAQTGAVTLDGNTVVVPPCP